MIHSWLCARKINTSKPSGPEGKGRPVFKKHKMNDLQSTMHFSACMDEEEGLFYVSSPKDLAHKLGCWQGINRWRELRTTELGFPKLTRKSKKWPSSIAVQRVHKAKASLAVAIQQHKANTGGSASRKCSEVAPVQGRDPLAQWQCQSSELGRAGASQHTKVLH